MKNPPKDLFIVLCENGSIALHTVGQLAVFANDFHAHETKIEYCTCREHVVQRYAPIGEPKPQELLS